MSNSRFHWVLCVILGSFFISFIAFVSISAGGLCGVREKSIYGQLQAMDLSHSFDKNRLIVDDVNGLKAVGVLGEKYRIWILLNKIGKNGKIYQYPGNSDYSLGCEDVDYLKNIEGANGHVLNNLKIKCK